MKYQDRVGGYLQSSVKYQDRVGGYLQSSMTYQDRVGVSSIFNEVSR